MEHCQYHNTILQIVLQNHNNKNRLVLAQDQTWRPVKQNIRLRNKTTQL
jgi:hypothetical protein